MMQPPRKTEENTGTSPLPLAPWPRELDADFENLGELGRGGLAIVYRARSRLRSRQVALKVFTPRFPEDAEALARIARDAPTISRLQHSNILRVFATRDLPKGAVAQVMQLNPGRTLKAELTKGAMSPARVERVLRDVANALDYAHQAGVVHGDVKPENIFIDEISGTAMLADFGVARIRKAPPGLTASGTINGTPRYMAPELFDGEDVSPRSDLYSLGIVGWEMLTGQRPWAGESLRNVIHRQKLDALPAVDRQREDIPPRLLYLLEGLMQKNPGRRWSSAGLFISMLVSSNAPPGLQRWQDSQERRRQSAAPETAEPVDSKPAEHSPSATRTTVKRYQQSKRRGHIMPVSAPENLPMGVKIGITAAVLVGALVVTFGLPKRGAAPAAETASTPALADSASPAAAETGGGRENAAAPNASTKSRRANPAPSGTVSSAGSLTGGVVGGSSSTAASRLASDTANQTKLDQPTSQPVPGSPPWPVAGQPAGRAGVRLRTRPLGPDISFPRETAPIGAGLRHSCMLESNGGGRALCWGNNQYGQLGDGTLEGHANPAPSARGMTFAQISVGSWHTCGLTSGGEVHCWGRNDYGQLGDGTTASRSTPSRVIRAPGFRFVRAGDAHTCGIAFDDTLRCWGSNAFGELGDGTQQARTAPITVTLPGRVRAVAAGFQHTCALVSDGSAYCWGRNHAGQLGNDTAIDASEPQLVVGDARFINIAAGSLHTCGVAVNGRAWCWGENVSGQLGAGVSSPASGRPLAVSGNQGFYSVVAGPSHSCGRARDGRILCWGRNNLGQLGNGTTTNQSRPVVATGVNGLVGLHTFGSHTCGVTANGDAWCWGANGDGQLGDAKRENATVPRRVRAPN